MTAGSRRRAASEPARGEAVLAPPGRSRQKLAASFALAFAFAVCACSDSDTPTFPRPQVAPALVSPDDGVVFTTDAERAMEFLWATVLDGDTYRVDVEIGTACTTAPIACSTWTRDASRSAIVGAAPHATVFADTFGRWRVRARSVLGEPGPWSPYRTFRFDVPPPSP